ncbi:MAG: alanine racemase [Candidatus Gastranaerophilales bacterium]|nr:alanine racemase [Candidatus Gastranaerophilales bacterium]
MKFQRLSNINTKRDAWVEINLDAIEKNILELKTYVKDNAKILAVVKADAYGHGSTMITPTLLASGVDYLGVASIDEGIELRNNKFTCPILVLGAAPVWAFDYAAQNNISLSVFLSNHLEAAELTYKKTGLKTKAHIKLDTGMNRIGVQKENAVDFIKKVQYMHSIELQGIFTHFACAEIEEETNKQLEIWNNILSHIDTKGLLLHCFNTAAAIAQYKEDKYNMVRLGLALYGLIPDLPAFAKRVPNLIPAMSLKGRITNIHTAHKGEGVSYSHKYKASGDIKIATIPVGYADGADRRLSNKIFGLLNGKKVPQIGNITMDQMMFDITGIDANEGDIITLLGKDGDESITINEWAQILDTINYELICRLKVRLSRVYTR